MGTPAKIPIPYRLVNMKPLSLLAVSLAPVLMIAIYIYLRDKYEREPLRNLVIALLAGAVSVIPILIVETILSLPAPLFTGYFQAAYNGFIVAGLTEELFKFLFLYFIFWNNRHFNEKFDGIVYAVFVSLGFAAVENVMYVFSNDISVGYVRAITAVPAHAIFGIVMGYHLGIARMYREIRRKHILRALFIPVFLHGLYNFILMSGHELALLVFVPYIFYLWFGGFKRMKVLSDSSIFRKYH
jgi:RsiW-degrading membrane proteinase PrsW (M82 family)